MWIHERHERLLGVLRERERLGTDECAALLGVSKETVRRDLIELEQVGKLRRVHGGAIPLVNARGEEPPLATRALLHAAAKEAIAREAAGLVERGMTCFINAGSTTHALAHALAGRRGFEVVTNALDIARTLSRHPGIEVTLIGGRVDPEVPATFGEQAIAEISRMNVDLALFSPVGVDPRLGAMEWFRHEAELARAMVEHSRHRVMLADASKLCQPSRVSVCELRQVDVLVTDGSADPQACARLQEAGLGRIVVAR